LGQGGGLARAKQGTLGLASKILPCHAERKEVPKCL
jgi:hypothetical protein